MFLGYAMEEVWEKTFIVYEVEGTDWKESVFPSPFAAVPVCLLL